MHRALALCALVAFGGCSENLGFGVAVTVEVDATISDSTLAQVKKMQVLTSGDESEQVVYDFPRPAFQHRVERFVFRPRPETRTLSMTVVVVDGDDTRLAAGGSGVLTLSPGRTTEATLRLGDPNAAMDMGVGDGGDFDAAPPPSFETAHRTVLSSYQIYGGGAVGDFNCDGNADLVMGLQGTPAGVIELNGDGKGGYGPPKVIGGGALGTASLLTALNADSDNCTDLLFVDATASTSRLLVGSSTGLGVPAAPVTIGSAYITGVAIGRFNGDAIDDVAINLVTGYVQIYSSTGVADTYAQTASVLSVYGPIAACNFDGDAGGHTDIAVLSASSGIFTFLGNGDGTLGATAIAGSAPTNAYALAADDFDGDGRCDVALSPVLNNNGVRILVGGPSGALAPPSPMPYPDLLTTESASAALQVADFDHDGHVDLLVAGASTTILRSLGNGQFAAPERYAPAYASLVAAKVDTDDFVDVVALGPVVGTDTPIEVLLNYGGAGAGQLRAVRFPVPSNGSGTGTGIAVGDAAKDGTANDVFVSGLPSFSSGYAVVTLPAPAPMTRRFGAPVVNPEMLGSWLAVGDLDGDGVADYSAAGMSGLAYRYLDTTGSGAVVAGSLLANPMASVAMGDLNGDKLDDLIAIDAANPPNKVWVFAAQAGRVVDPTGSSYPLAGRPSAVAVGDVIVDAVNDPMHYLDVVVALTDTYQVEVFPGLGNGMLGATPLMYSTGTKPTGITIADLDGDGKLDFATANNGSSSVSIFLSDGAGGFRTPIEIKSVSPAPNRIAAADLNGDGFVDLVVTDSTDSRVWVLPGRPGAAYGSPVGYPVGGPQNQLAIADLDGDGKPDLIVGVNGANVLFNNTP